MKKNFLKIISAIIFTAVLFSLTVFLSNGADNFEKEIADFPESYKVQLRELHKKYPKWKFQCVDTGLDWFEAVEGENYAPSAKETRSAIMASASDYLKDKSSGFYDASSGTYTVVDAGFVRANRIAISYYMDPRNFLNETDIYQFELLSFSDTLTANDVDQVLKGTFMYNTKVTYYDTEGKKHTNSFTYAECIYNAGKEYNVNPCFLASKIRGEVVVSGGGPSGSVTGQYKGYEGYYNFFNIGAYADAVSPIANGLKYASGSGSYGRPWDTPKKSIYGGAQFLAQSYIAKGQNTSYFQKFNVSPNAVSAVYTHQYMSNVSGVISQAKTTYSSYSANGLLDMARTFAIPVYRNMPGADGQMSDFSLFDSKGQTAVPTTVLNVRTEPSTSGKFVVSVRPETSVTVLSKCRNTSSSVTQQIYYPFWYKITFIQDNVTYTGYAVAEYLDISSTLNVNKGDKFTLPFSSDVDEQPTLYTWDTSIVSLSADGTVKASKKGTAYITATTSAGGYDYIKVKVNSYDVSALNVSGFSAKFSSGGAEFSWNTVNGASGYEFILTKDGKNILCQSLSADITKLTIPSVDLSKGLSARVRAYKLTSSSKLNGAYSELNIEDITLGKVKGLKCDNIASTSYTMKWNAVSGACGYEVYKYNASKGEYELMDEVIDNFCEITSQAIGSSDKYKVRAYADFAYGRVYGSFSSAVQGYTFVQNMKTPSFSSVGKNSATVKWSSVSGANIYYIYMLDVKQGKYTKIGETSSKSYKLSSLTVGTSYSLRIEAYNTSNTSKMLSACDFTLNTICEKVTGAKQSSSTGYKVKIKWTAVSGASSYHVYIFDSSANDFVLYNTTTSNSCTISGLSPVTTKRVVIRASVENYGKEFFGEYSDELKIYTGPKKPSGITVSEISFNHVKLKWSKKSGAAGYKIYSVNESGKTTYLTSTSSTSCTVESLLPDTTYNFIIRSYRTVGKTEVSGSDSDVFSIKTAPNAITGISSGERSKSGYTLKWNEYSGADGYVIYRYDATTGKYSEIARTTDTEYKVENLYSAKKDKYKIAGYIAYDGKKYVGKLSEEYETTTSPKNPTQVCATLNKNGGIDVSWQKAARASGCRVYLYNSNTKSWEYIGSSTKASYTIPAGKINAVHTKIRVRSYVKVGSVNYYSSGVKLALPEK